MTTILCIILLVGGWTVFAYNRLVRDRTRVLTAWSDIDVQLKRRHDLIPKLVEAVKQYAAYESAALGAVTELRAGRAPGETGVAERSVSAELTKLLAVAEAYPELKANASFLDLQRNLTEVEQHIQYARRFYNGSVRNLNIRVESFPDSIIASAFQFKPAEFFDYEPE